MNDHSTDLCFTSDLFDIERGEDKETNTQLYGKQLSHWLADKLRTNGYSDAKVLAEDFGWCVVCYRKPFMLWVACGNSETPDDPAEMPKEPIIWEFFVAAEVPFWKKIFGKLETKSEQRALNEKLRSLILAESRIQIVECP